MALTVRIGSRPSRLALTQAAIVRERLAAVASGLSAEIVEIRTSGDKMTSASLAQVGGKGLFIRELEQALKARTIDIAVHSMKDLPAALPPEFRLAAVPERVDPRDVLVTRTGDGFESLPAGTRLGTSSSRRQFEALRVNPHLSITPLRGNVDTRLKRIEEGGLDAIILAMAGLQRLNRLAGLKLVPLDERDFIPSGGQGALAIEMLQNSRLDRPSDLERALTAINDARAMYEIAAERAYLATIGASCVTPVGVRAVAAGGSLSIRAIVFSRDGARELADALQEPLDSDLAPSVAEAAGVRLGERMLARGAGALVGDA
ncbi:MAG TPA: hydroxymethylbilane synthase [Candidatus Binataceae bacterium]|nr:hydroxymethylbilane synthase [Candidatus Binataceae bacterium]